MSVIRFSIRFTENEYKYLYKLYKQECCKNLGTKPVKSLPDWMKERIMYGTIFSTNFNMLLEPSKILDKYGNTINDIARVCNEKKHLSLNNWLILKDKLNDINKMTKSFLDEELKDGKKQNSNLTLAEGRRTFREKINFTESDWKYVVIKKYKCEQENNISISNLSGWLRSFILFKYFVVADKNGLNNFFSALKAIRKNINQIANAIDSIDEGFTPIEVQNLFDYFFSLVTTVSFIHTNTLNKFTL